MKTTFKAKAIFVLVSLAFMLTVVVQASAEKYKSMEGVKSVKVIFDFRDATLESALVHIKLIHDTYKDKVFMTEKPEFAVVFMGPSVMLLSKNKDGFSAKDKKIIEEIRQVISAMAKDGIRLEICMFAANLFGVAPDSVLPELHHVANGWISSIGYQTKGYVLVPVF
ncbi:MAG: sulfur reduction protein DsrE [Desulfobacteraceae bacterium]|nr:MAG: sulfur reduction protein DsrE [Desulfobacteraceae bacterium]